MSDSQRDAYAAEAQTREVERITDATYAAAKTLATLTRMNQEEAMKVLDLIVLRDREGMRYSFFERALSATPISPLTGRLSRDAS